jgi:myosin heavy subunit
METQNNQQSPLTKIALVVMTAIAGTFGYLWYGEKNQGDVQQTEIQVKAEEIADARMKIDSISAQLDQKIQEIQALGGQVEELNEAKSRLEKDRAALKAGQVKAKDLQTKLADYELLLAEKDKQIAQLRNENETLTTENKSLNSQNQNLNSENTNLKTDIESKAKTIEETSSKNKELSEKVAIAAALKANEVVVNAIAENGKERDGGKYRAGRVSKLKVMFNLAPNPLTQQENKTIALRVLGPDGAVMSDMATGSGTMTYLGKEVTYTATTTAMYSNNNQVVSIVWGKGNTDWKEGTYGIELYSEGFKIGQGAFTIK